MPNGLFKIDVLIFNVKNHLKNIFFRIVYTVNRGCKHYLEKEVCSFMDEKSKRSTIYLLKNYMKL